MGVMMLCGGGGGPEGYLRAGVSTAEPASEPATSQPAALAAAQPASRRVP